MKIIVAGAGIGGLYSAYLFGKRGHAVVVYEKEKSVEDLRYDWHDDVNPGDLKKLGLKIPQESFLKKDWTFVSPGGNVQQLVQSEQNKDYSIERKPFNKYLYGLASEYADVVFGKTIAKAYIEDGKVAGVVFADGEVEKCDLVIDSCGVDSVIRRSLPTPFGVDNEVETKSVFFAYRGFFNAVPDAKVEYTNKVYMKHCGENGISWCIVDNDPAKVDVLVGRIDKLEKQTLDNALEKLREDNPVLGQELQKGGIVCKIPVRRPLDLFVADGYAGIGDSACMTIPLIGSGIATSLYASQFLFEAVGEGNDSSVKKLWAYQRKVYEEFGAEHCGVDYLKNWLLAQKNTTIDGVFGTGVMSNHDLQETSIGKLINITPAYVMEKIRVAGIKKLFGLIPMGLMLIKTHKIAKIAKQIPQEYDELKIAKWANKLDKVCESGL